MKSIGYFAHQPSGCYLYRIKHPMDALNAHGFPTVKIGLDQDIDLENMQSLQVYGIYPFSFSRALKILKDDNKKLVYDLDDATELIDETNPFYLSVKRDTFSQREILPFMDHITASTPVIADYIRGKTQAPITIVPNCYSPNEWMYPRPKREGIRIGFAGSTSHIPDLLMVLPAIKNLQKKYDIKFILFGFGPEDYESWLRSIKFMATEEALKCLEEFESFMKEIDTEWVPFIDFSQFPDTLTNISLDIGLCPLTDTPFNRARSASKAMEYTLSGALALASDLEPYRADPTSILVKDTEWEEKLEYYILNIEERKKRHKEHLEWIQQNRNINSPRMIDLLKSIYVV